MPSRIANRLTAVVFLARLAVMKPQGSSGGRAQSQRDSLRDKFARKHPRIQISLDLLETAWPSKRDAEW